ncbi:hypothetical protein AKJ57_01580 [candidate division MSBL1 archaeon SCGC-AAA259A05]|uniref:Xylose isomerase-like TIM barrel domain-containing protein n=1 Tax=candidate division MSBL1 archaeon SCGC-AAA259A05 TaxID=1698259 RepID=A0A133UAZ8_9EURY|nr:hypothetical protein AKJ57_01580 [candidate division MSBL1 archaeon SCGC-AAA259A05]
MNKYGIFYGFWTEQWGGGLEYFKIYLSKADGLGFDILELNCDFLMELSKSERKELSEEARVREIDLTFNTNLNEKNDISSDKYEVRERGVEHLKKCLELINEIGGEILTGVTYGPWSDVKVWRDLVGDRTLDEEAKKSLEFLRERIG